MFGNGTRTTHNARARDNRTGEPVRSRFDNAMCAHVWAQCSQSFGQSSNGNLYFEGRTLYSYGSHFAVGFLAPEPSTGEGVARALVTTDRHSVTTSGHVSDARRAVTGALYVPGLTRLARHFETGASIATRVRAAWVESGRVVPTEWNAAAYAEYLTPHVAAHVAAEVAADLDSLSHDDAAALFALAGASNPAAKARAAIQAGLRKASERKAEEARRKTETRLHDARAIAERATPAALADLAARMKETARTLSGSPQYEVQRIEAKGKEAHRAARAAKAKGWTRIAAACRAYHRTLREGIPEFFAAERRRNRRKAWAREVETVRAALAALADKTPGATEEAARRRAFALRSGVAACGELGAALGAEPGQRARHGFAAKSARLAGLSPEGVAARLADLAARFKDAAEEGDNAARRLSYREGVAAMRRTTDSSLSATERAAAAKTVESFCYFFAVRPYGEPRPAPAVFRVAGWTPQTFARARDAAAAIRKELDSQIAAERKARELAERKAREEAAAAWVADARAAWRAGLPGPVRPAGVDYTQANAATRCEGGGAMLRAKDVERDAAGQVVGGELVTSQGATVPLAHALRAFRFLKLCRERGEEWNANGRTVRVGHFRIDRVTAAGDFRAGCHSILWEEVARLAGELGVADLTAEDAREPA